MPWRTSHAPRSATATPPRSPPAPIGRTKRRAECGAAPRRRACTPQSSERLPVIPRTAPADPNSVRLKRARSALGLVADGRRARGALSRASSPPRAPRGRRRCDSDCRPCQVGAVVAVAVSLGAHDLVTGQPLQCNGGLEVLGERPHRPRGPGAARAPPGAGSHRKTDAGAWELLLIVLQTSANFFGSLNTAQIASREAVTAAARAGSSSCSRRHDFQHQQLEALAQLRQRRTRAACVEGPELCDQVIDLILDGQFGEDADGPGAARGALRASAGRVPGSPAVASGGVIGACSSPALGGRRGAGREHEELQVMGLARCKVRVCGARSAAHGVILACPGCAGRPAIFSLERRAGARMDTSRCVLLLRGKATAVIEFVIEQRP